MKQTIKDAYVAPSIEIIEMENEGVIASSNNTINGIGNGGGVGTPTRSSRSYGASSSDLEDMINDILTVEN